MTAATAPQEGPALPPIASVLAVVDPADDEETLQAAAELTARHRARLEVLTCLEPPPDLVAVARATGLPSADVIASLTDERRQRMVEAVRRVLPEVDAAVHVAVGKPFIDVIRHALRLRIDLVVKQAEPLSGLPGLLFASTDQHLLRKCPCPVWLRAPGAVQTPRTVVVAVDVDDVDASEPETLAGLNRRVIETGLRLAAPNVGVVHVLHAWEAIGEGLVWTFASGSNPRLAAEVYVNEVETARRRSLVGLLRPFRERAAGAPRLQERLVRGPARNVIADEARRLSADVVVMGTVARTGLGGVIIGNTAEDILNTVDCSVVAVKPEGFVSPILAESPEATHL